MPESNALPDFADRLEQFMQAVTKRGSHSTKADGELGKALDLIIESDPRTVNLTQCAKVLGMTRPTLYRHLENRRQHHAD